VTILGHVGVGLRKDQPIRLLYLLSFLVHCFLINLHKIFLLV